MYEYLITEIDAATGINRVTLNRPERRNALSGELVAELKDALSLAAADDRIRVIALAGAGPDFCAGADLHEVQAAVEEGVMASLADAESLGDAYRAAVPRGRPGGRGGRRDGRDPSIVRGRRAGMAWDASICTTRSKPRGFAGLENGVW